MYRNTTVSKLLFNTLQEEDPTEWTKLKIREYIAARGKFNLEQINYLLKNNFASIRTSTSTSISTIKNPILPAATPQPTPTP